MALFDTSQRNGLTEPAIIIIAGPNGAGKSTSAPALVPVGVPYINADEIAKDLTGLPDDARRDFEASRRLLSDWDRYAAESASFAIETTLASRSLAPKIRKLKEIGYLFLLYFFWLPSPDLAVARVEERVRMGGHHIPEDVIRRRYQAGIRNFFEIFRPIADQWLLHSNVEPGQPVLIAEGRSNGQTTVADNHIWRKIVGGSDAMNNIISEPAVSYDAISPEARLREKAVIKAICEAVRQHKLAGNPIATWRDGRVVIVQPEDIELDESEI